MNPLNKSIAHLAPCYDAAKWLEGYTDPQTAWDECTRGDWMVWLLISTGAHTTAVSEAARAAVWDSWVSRDPATRAAARAKHADIVRRHFPNPPTLGSK